MAAAGGRRMVQKESQAALEERENELNSNPAASAGAPLEPPAATAPGEDNPGTGAGGAAVTGAAGGARRFLCGVVEGERSFPSRPGINIFSGGEWGFRGLEKAFTPLGLKFVPVKMRGEVRRLTNFPSLCP